MLIESKLYEEIIRKKKRLDELRPLSNEALDSLRKAMLVDLAYNSDAIEGNTLTHGETKLVIEEGLTIGGKSLREHLEAINHVEALSAIENEARHKGLSEESILYIHSIVLKGIDKKYAGIYRDHNVRISGSSYVPPPFYDVPRLMQEFVEETKNKEKKTDPVELAAYVHFRLVDIHPFTDGNGRTARLLMNLMLFRSGYPISVILKSDRRRYYRTLDAAHNGDMKPFFNLVARAVDRSLTIYLQTLEKKRTPEYISLEEATKYCNYSQEYLSLLARKGDLHAVKFGRNWMTTKDDVIAYVRRVKRR